MHYVYFIHSVGISDYVYNTDELQIPFLLGFINNVRHQGNISKTVVSVLVLLFVALWFILRDGLFCVLPCVVLFMCFSVLLALRLPRLGRRELILVLFVRLFDLRLFGFVCFLFLLGRAAVCDRGTPWTFLLPFYLPCSLKFWKLIAGKIGISTKSKKPSHLDLYCLLWSIRLTWLRMSVMGNTSKSDIFEILLW